MLGLWEIHSEYNTYHVCNHVRYILAVWYAVIVGHVILIGAICFHKCCAMSSVLQFSFERNEDRISQQTVRELGWVKQI